jgi:hypothetical protein
MSKGAADPESEIEKEAPLAKQPRIEEEKKEEAAKETSPAIAPSQVIDGLDPRQEKYFRENVLVWTGDDVEELGFKDLRLNVLKQEKIQETVWDYYGNHGCFIGGAPMTKGYVAGGMVAEATTPFDRLYYVYRGTAMPPLLAYRLRADVLKRGPCYDGKGSRVFDTMEMLDWNCQGEKVCLQELIDEEGVPEQSMNVPETFFLQHYGTVAQKWV